MPAALLLAATVDPRLTEPPRLLSEAGARDVRTLVAFYAGVPVVESTALHLACAHWLRSQGLSDHEVAHVLRLACVRSVDRLLRHHAALDAQHTVRETRLDG